MTDHQFIESIFWIGRNWFNKRNSITTMKQCCLQEKSFPLEVEKIYLLISLKFYSHLASAPAKYYQILLPLACWPAVKAKWFIPDDPNGSDPLWKTSLKSFFLILKSSFSNSFCRFIFSPLCPYPVLSLITRSLIVFPHKHKTLAKPINL